MIIHLPTGLEFIHSERCQVLFWQSQVQEIGKREQDLFY